MSGFGDTIQISVFGLHLEFYSLGSRDMKHFGGNELNSLDPMFPVAQDRPGRPNLEHCRIFIETRLRECVASHGECGPNLNQRHPTRVLYIDEKNDLQFVQLRVTAPEDSIAYVALSHCWGSENSVPKTTRANFQSNVQGIRISDLPKTFRDAIMLTKALKIKHLWIDSLCIVQDDHLDWEAESSFMADIYSNAMLTLSATASKDGHGGCLFDRWTCQMSPRRHISMEPVALKGPSKKNSPDFVFVRPRPLAHDSFLSTNAQLHETPELMKRAWAFQERLLSVRLIHFNNEELVWECKTSLDCECGEFQRYPTKMRDSLKILYDEFQGNTRARSLMSVASENRWARIISKYSERALTFDNDRLPALSGLASRLEQGDGYVAGLWRSELERTLGWGRKVRWDDSEMGQSVRCSAPTPPSWSWASITSAAKGKPEPVYFPTIFGHSGPVTSKVHVIECVCSLVGVDQFGAVSGGYLRMDGKVIAAELNHDHDRGDIHRIVFGDNHSALFLTDISCENPASQSPEPVQALLLLSSSLSPYFAKPHERNLAGASSDDRMRTDFVLVLRAIREGQYERVGIAIADQEWELFTHVSMSEVTLV